MTGQQQINKASLGAGLGAVTGGIAGAIIGNNTGDRNASKGAIVGALAGAAVGGGIGVYMDRQEAAIRQELQGSGVSVTRSGNDLLLNMPSDITFDVAQSSLRNEFTSTLGSVALVLKKYDKTKISVTGHTDSDGSTSYNQGLSEQRARSVASVLGQNGVTGSRLLTQGYGESSPIANNGSTSGKAQNRRVEMKIVPEQSQF